MSRAIGIYYLVARLDGVVQQVKGGKLGCGLRPKIVGNFCCRTGESRGGERKIADDELEASSPRCLPRRLTQSSHERRRPIDTE